MSRITFRLCYALLIIILAVACSNFICISCSVQKITAQTNLTLNHIDTLLMQNNTLNGDDIPEIALKAQEINDSIDEINSLKKGIFDSNTITFLASFLLIFLGGILFDIEKRAKATVTQSQKIIGRMDLELNQLNIYRQTSSLAFLSKYLNYKLSDNNYKIDTGILVIVYEIHSTLKSIQALFRDPNIKFITEDAKNENRGRLRAAKLILEKEDIDNTRGNKSKLTPIVETRKILNDCISMLDQIKTFKAEE